MKKEQPLAEPTATIPRHHPLVALARAAVEAWVRERKVLPPPEEASAEMRQRAGVFICVKACGELRGCIGTYEPSRSNVAQETIHNAIAAVSDDPRFWAVEAGELCDLEYTVDVLTEPERVTSESELDPKRYGVIVRCGARRGLLLPDLQGVNTVEEQVGIAKRKAGISPLERVELYRFTMQRYT
ncbi:MAG: AmmeMemoRadiSam system protein A [Chloroflexota bacterium]